MPAAEAVSTIEAVASEARDGLTATPRTLAPWLFYDEAGSALFERITELPEYYLTRTERAILEANASDILQAVGPNLTIAELGAGTATKTGILLRAAALRQTQLLYQPVDVSPSALAEAHALERSIPTLTVRPQVANYITDPIHIHRPQHHRILALYIGSSIGNFSPAQARSILINLRRQLHPGDALLLGTDLAPGPNKPIETLLHAYDDAQGVTAAFNRNILVRLNRDLGANFDPDRFRHVARWNPTHSRIEMHLESLTQQTVHIPAHPPIAPPITLRFAGHETIHTENSYKFTRPGLTALLHDAGFTPTQVFEDPRNLFAVTLANAT